MRAVTRVAASRKRPLITTLFGGRVAALSRAALPSAQGIKSQRDLFAAMLSEWIDKGTVRRGIQLLELSGHRLEAPLLEQGMRECEAKDAQEVALLFREYCEVAEGPVPLELYHLAMRAAISQQQVATFTRATAAFLTSYRDKKRGTMGRFTQGVKAKWWEAVMEQCEQHEQGGKCASSLLSEMASVGLPIPKALARRAAPLIQQGEDTAPPTLPASSRTAAALGLTETRLQDLASENDVDGLVSLLTSLSPEYVASLSDHTYTAVWRAFRRTQRAADALSLLRRLEASMDTPTTEGPPTTIMRSGGGAGEAGNGRNKGGKPMGGGSGRMAEGERDEETVHDTVEETAEEETAERYRVPASAYDGVLTVLCDAKQRDAALDLFEHMLHEGVALRSEGPSSLLHLTGDMNLASEAMALLQRLTHELDYTPSLDAYNAVIWGCVRMRLVDDAMQAYDSLESRGLVGNHRTMNGCLSALVMGQRWDDVRQLYAQMRTHKVHLDVMSYQLILTACAKLRDGPEALRLIKEMRDLRFLPAAPCYTSAISACGACHMKDDALALFHEARRLKVLDNANATNRQLLYGAVLRACAETGDTDTVMSLLHDMRQGGVAINRFLYTSALHACSVARDSDLALRLLQDMHDSGTTPDLPPLTAALMAHSRADRPDRVLSLLDHMTSLDFTPSDVALRLGVSAAHAVGRHARAADFCQQGLQRGKVIPPDIVHLAIVSCHDHLTPEEGVALMDMALRAGVRVRLDSVKLAVAMAEKAGDRASRIRLAALASCLTEGWTSNMTPMPGPKRGGGAHVKGATPFDRPRRGSALEGFLRSRGQGFTSKAPK